MKRIASSILMASVSAANMLIAGPTMAQDKPSAPMDRLNDFVGDGTCSGNVPAMDKKPGHATAGKYHGEKTLDGHWVVVHYEQDQSAVNPKPFKVLQYFGYDPANKQFITVMVGNGDGAYSVGVSRGWQGNSITFDEVEMARGKRGDSREAFTTGTSGLSGYTGWFRDKNGKWVKTDEETCHKA